MKLLFLSILAVATSALNGCISVNGTHNTVTIGGGDHESSVRCAQTGYTQPSVSSCYQSSGQVLQSAQTVQSGRPCIHRHIYRDRCGHILRIMIVLPGERGEIPFCPENVRAVLAGQYNLAGNGQFGDNVQDVSNQTRYNNGQAPAYAYGSAGYGAPCYTYGAPRGETSY